MWSSYTPTTSCSPECRDSLLDECSVGDVIVYSAVSGPEVPQNSRLVVGPQPKDLLLKDT